MNLVNFLYYCQLRDYTIMGITNKNLERISLQQLVYKKKQELFKCLFEYFELGLKASVFGEAGKVSGPNDRLWTGFNQGQYIYFVHRQPKGKKAPVPQGNSLLNSLLQEVKLRE